MRDITARIRDNRETSASEAVILAAYLKAVGFTPGNAEARVTVSGSTFAGIVERIAKIDELFEDFVTILAEVKAEASGDKREAT